MKKKGIKNKISRLVLATAMVMGLFASVGAAVKVSAAIGPAPSDWAFEESSRELNDAIVAEYPTLGDANGYITIPSANAMTGVLDVSNKGISGTMDGIENFISLSNLSLNNNNLVGEIPANIGNITNLQQIHFANNHLTGTIPVSIGNLSQLTNLFLQANELSGSIPSELGNASNLYAIYLNYNNLDGAIPANLSNLPQLATLVLHANKLNGNIPTELGQLSNLVTFTLSSNNLSGNIPNELGDLIKLVTLTMDNNELTGSIPSSLGNITTLKSLYLSSNDLSGSIPQSIYDSNSLEYFFIDANTNITGDISTGFENNTTLKWLGVGGTSTSQVKPAISTLEVFLNSLVNNDQTNIVLNLSQNDIDNVKGAIQIIINERNPIRGSGSELDLLLTYYEGQVALAQKMLDAKNKVDTLLVTPGLNDLKPGITINDIDDAQDLVTALPNGSLKDELQAKIDTARNITDAKDKVDGLLTTPDLSNLKPGVDAGVINDAQDAVNKLPAGSLKDELQDKVNTAKNLLDAENKVIDLFNPDGSLATNTNQNKIDEAQKAVNLLPNGTTKDLLQALIDEAQSLLNAQSRETLVVAKPSVATTQNGAVNTSDGIYTNALVALLLSSIAVLGYATKRKFHK